MRRGASPRSASPRSSEERSATSSTAPRRVKVLYLCFGHGLTTASSWSGISPRRRLHRIVTWYAVFNVADMFVVCGCIVLVLYELRHRSDAAELPLNEELS